MTGRQSAATDRALRMILCGAHPVDVARLAGVHLATVYRMMKRSGLKNIAEDRRRK